MGDTFQDKWEPPVEFRGFKLEEVDNTKWDGNYYRYARWIESPTDGLPTKLWFDLHSASPRELRLGGRIGFDTDDYLSVTWDLSRVGDSWWTDSVEVSLGRLHDHLSDLYRRVTGKEMP